ncbi:MAG: cell envelope integrity protein TolA [Ramlibacter sp.]
MEVDADRLDFAPPPQPDLWRAFVLAIFAHLLLLLALTWGVNWKREAENVTAEAELWSSVKQQAAPAAVQPPVVQAPPLPVPMPPRPVEKVAPPPPPPVQARKEPDIALEREKQKRELAERRQEELDRQKKVEARKKQEQQKREQLAEKRAEEETRKREEQAKSAKASAARQREDDKKLAASREDQMRRIQGMAGATGAPESKGTAQRASGPSDSYGGRVRARVRPNIVFADDIAGNPTAEVEVRMAPDGTIISRRLLKSSGARNWDDAVLRALDKTEVLPRDVDGRVPTPIIIEFRPKG